MSAKRGRTLVEMGGFLSPFHPQSSSPAPRPTRYTGRGRYQKTLRGDGRYQKTLRGRGRYQKTLRGKGAGQPE